MFFLSGWVLLWFLLFPILLWGYAVRLLSDHEWNRSRFFYGMIGWWISVAVLHFFTWYLQGSFLMRAWAIFFVLAVLFLFVFITTGKGSPYVKVFLRKTALLHITLFTMLYIFFEGISKVLVLNIHEYLPLYGWIVWYVFAASIEESTKHLSSVGLTAKEFRFSRKDLLIFIFFISLGFVCVENSIYLIQAFPHGITDIIFTGINRSIFSLLAHLFSASICVMFWWKALSYGVFSWRYIAIFLAWFILSSLSHVGFNLILIYAPYWWVLLYALVAYTTFTQWLVLDEP